MAVDLAAIAGGRIAVFLRPRSGLQRVAGGPALLLGGVAPDGLAGASRVVARTPSGLLLPGREVRNRRLKPTWIPARAAELWTG